MLRTDTIYGMLCEGYSRANIILYASEMWEITERQTDNYLANARKRLELDCAMTREAFLAEAIGRLRNYEGQAAKRGQLQVATNSVRLQAELLSITGKN